MQCPGQDTRYWKTGDIFEVECPACSTVIEFFKTDSGRKCSKCGERFSNPRLDLGCANYCKFANKCSKEIKNGNANNAKLP